MSVEEKVRLTLDKIRPRLQADGGDAEFVSFEGGKVNVRLTGHCCGCPMATLTLKQGIEAEMRASIPEVQEVVQVA